MLFSKFRSYRTHLECPKCKDWLPSAGNHVLRTGKCRRCQQEIISDHIPGDEKIFQEERWFTWRKILGKFIGTFGMLFVVAGVGGIATSALSKQIDWMAGGFALVLGLLLIWGGGTLIKSSK